MSAMLTDWLGLRRWQFRNCCCTCRRC